MRLRTSHGISSGLEGPFSHGGSGSAISKLITRGRKHLIFRTSGKLGGSSISYIISRGHQTIPATSCGRIYSRSGGRVARRRGVNIHYHGAGKIGWFGWVL
jgi:hypothetical protein